MWHNFTEPYFMHHWTSHWGPGRKAPSRTGKLFLDWIYPFHVISSNFCSGGRKAPSPPLPSPPLPHYLPPPLPSLPHRNRDFFRLDLSISCNFQQLWFQVAEKLPPSFLPFRGRPGLCHPCGILMVPILQIHTQIPPIWISSLGYQLYQLFKILTYREVQNTGSWCRWKSCRQPYHNTY